MRKTTICFLLFISLPLCAHPSLDSLLYRLSLMPSDTQRVYRLNQLAYQIVSNDPSQAKKLAESALQLSEQLHFKRGKADALFQLGYFYKVRGNYSLTVTYALKALKIYESVNYIRGIADCYNLMGIILYTKNQQVELSYLFKAQQLYESIRDSSNVAKLYNNIGDTYMELGKYEEGLASLEKGLALAQRIHDEYIVGLCYSSMGEIYMKKQEYQKAKRFISKGVEVFKKYNDKNLLAYTLECLGIICHKQGNNQLALLYTHQALDTAQRYGFLEEIKRTTQALSDMYAGLKQYQKAYHFHSLYTAAKDSLVNEESTRKIADLQSEYKLEKKQAEISLLQKDRQIKAKETERQQTFIYFLLVGSALGLSLSFLGLRSFRQTKKINQLLQNQKEDSERQKKAISEQNAALEEKNRELVVAKEKAEAASKAKADFLSTMSHEIRTPMNAVLGLTHLLIQEEPKPEQVSHLNTLMFSAENLLALINDILDFSKIEAGKIELETIDFDIRELVGSIRDAQAIHLNDRAIDLYVVWDENIPRTVGDPVRLGQILTNLVSNAVKFTDQGVVSIEVRLVAKKDEQATLHFSVTDTGIGIPADKVDDIFESFTQAHANTTRIFGGTGLGLAITKKLLTLMNSQIWVESEPGKGSRFSFELTLDISKTMSAQAKNSAANSQTGFKLKGVRILLVDDHEINLLIASTFLKKWEVEVDTAENGLLALEKVRQNIYDAVLMDLQMPVMDGYEAAAAIRKLAIGDPYYQTLPIFALTADAMTDVKERVLAAGMNDYVTKPFIPNELYQKIVKYTLSQLSGVKQ